jgi:hypothetical protein
MDSSMHVHRRDAVRQTQRMGRVIRCLRSQPVLPSAPDSAVTPPAVVIEGKVIVNAETEAGLGVVQEDHAPMSTSDERARPWPAT